MRLLTMRGFLLGLSFTAAAFAGCRAFAPPPAQSNCAADSSEFVWTNAPQVPQIERRSGRPYYDPVAGDPALASGIRVRGTLEFQFGARGPHLVEIFLSNPEIERYAFRLESRGNILDERPLIAPGPGRLRPKRGTRHLSLLAVVEGPAALRVKTDAPGYVLSAARWTPVEEFDREVVPRYLERARYVRAHILLEKDGENPTARRQYLQQLGDRLWFSRRADAKQEGLLDRTRAWFWVAAENHEPDDVLATHRLFEQGLALIPEDPILRQMISASCAGQVIRVDRMPHGEYCRTVDPVAWKVEVPPSPARAPEWAVTQRRLARRMEALTRWWVEKRQAADGELGGGWGDDVEILRHWGPQALGFGSRVAGRGILNVAEGLWNSGTLLHGYDRGISDVEHSSEPTTDTQPLSAALDPENGGIRDRLGTTAACSQHWIAKQSDGHFRFRSSWFNCRDADTSPGRAVDVHLNTRAMGPALWYAYLSRDALLIRRIAAWADAWIAAMRSTAGGKPAGLFPPALRSANGEYLIGSDRWDKPAAEWDYYQWSGGSQEALTSLMLATFDLTGDRKYLQATTESFGPLGNCAAQAEICREMRGSPEAFLVWRRITGDRSHDRFFGFHPESTDSEVLDEMAGAAATAEKRFGVNWDMFTTEVLYTDRVYYPLPPEYRWRLFGGEAPRGDRYPSFAVTWPPAEMEFARAVLAATGETVRIRLCSFMSKEAPIAVRLWRLKPGSYKWRCGVRQGSFTITRLPHTLSVPLPPGYEVTFEILPAGG